MYEPSPFEDSRGLRLAADEDFMRSLDQLEDLLEEDLISATAEHLKSKEHSNRSTQNAAQQTGPQQTDPDRLNPFGGSILDVIPLAERLGERLDSTVPLPANDAEPNGPS
ncbi:MAG: hypothetical protein AAFP03_05415 [Cyanobacteria bacterium J06598_3]